MHPDTLLLGFLPNYFRNTEIIFLRSKFFLLFIFFRVAFYSLILAIGIHQESDRANFYAPNPKLKSH